MAMNRIARLPVDFYRDPNPNEYALHDHRWEWRPISQNPFIKRKSEGKQAPDTPTTSPEDPIVRNEDAPKWVHLFYDLAWTATFSSLTQNGRFNQPWDTVSYIGFFVLMWWLWAAQAMYTIHFYTNDWFHFGSNIIQLGIFGMLAATTRGYDISNYIAHSPGTDTLESAPRQMSDITDPTIYSAEVAAATSLRVIAISVTISRRVSYVFRSAQTYTLWHRIVLLVQYVRILAYARAMARTGTNHDVLLKIAMVPIGMLISIPLFFCAWMISTSAAGRTPYGAEIKFVLWGVALLVEMLSHVAMARLDWRRGIIVGNLAQKSAEWKSDWVGPTPTVEPPSGTDEDKLPIPYSDVTLSERLEGITTIILGEGINSIAGSLWAVISASGYEKSVASDAMSAAITVCFLTYFYFEGPIGRQHPKGLRQMIWLLLHLPFLLAVILLLLGMKDQFMLTSYLSTIFTSLNFPSLFVKEGIDPINPSGGNHTVVKEYFIKHSIMWSEEWEILLNKLGPIEGGKMNQSQMFDVIAWQWRLMLKLGINTFKMFMGENKEIPDYIQSKIDLYNANRTLPVLDNRISAAKNSTDTMQYFQILTSLVDGNVQGARYIAGLAGGVFICLSLLSLAHSKPRDRFQWGIVLSRFGMGLALVSLLLLNLGRYQTLWIYPELGQRKHQAGIFQWITAYWVLPTIALAHFVELFITGLARLRINEISRRDSEVARRAEAVEMIEEARRDGQDVTSGMLEPAEPYMRPRLGELAWREGRHVVREIREGIIAVLVRFKLKSKEPKYIEVTDGF